MAGQAIVTVNGSTWDVYLANTYAELAQGLAGVVSMSAGTGMIFDTGYDHAIGVTTEQMLFSLDIAFVSSELKVVEIHSNVAPGAVLAGSEPARYFLEVNAGELAAVSIGDDVSIEVVSTPVYVAPAISSEDIVNMAVMIGAAIVFSGLAWEMMGVGPYGHEYGGRHERGVVTPSADEDVWVRDGEQMLVSKHAEDYELMWLEGEGWRRARPEEWPYRGSSYTAAGAPSGWRAQLRRMSTRDLKLAYDRVRVGEPTGIEIVDSAPALGEKLIYEILYERGRAPGAASAW